MKHASVVSSLLAASALLLCPAPARAQDLAPPPATDTSGLTASLQSQDSQLSKDEKKDSGRGLEWVYLDAHAGFSYVDMASFSNSSLGLQQTSSEGAALGVGAGIRLFILTLGARATVNELANFNLWQLDGELGFHIPLGHWDPYFGLHGGYAFVGTLDSSAISSAASGQPSVAVHGGDAGLQIGLDYYFNHYLSLGFEVSGNALFLHRPPAPLPAGVSESMLPANLQQLYNGSGDSVGVGAIGSLHLGVHL